MNREQYKEDPAFIDDAFQNVWADSINFYLVEQNKKTEDGGKIYIDAKNYFREAAVKDAILTENMDELINYKLTHITPNGAECCNNKFNDSLEQQGHVLEPNILKTWATFLIKSMKTSKTMLQLQISLPYQTFKPKFFTSIWPYKVRGIQEPQPIPRSGLSMQLTPNM